MLNTLDMITTSKWWTKQPILEVLISGPIYIIQNNNNKCLSSKLIMIYNHM